MRTLLISGGCPDARYLKKALSEASHSVDEQTDSRGGAFVASEERFDLVILMAPSRATGDEMCTDVAKLRSIAPGVVLAVISDRISAEARTALLGHGADASFERPVSILEFSQRVKRLLRIRAPNLAARISVLDAETLTYVTGALHCKLTQHEFLLIECLLRANEQAVARELIIRYVWPAKDDVNPASLNLLVSRLRAKLRSHGMPVLLVVVPAVGYAWRSDAAQRSAPDAEESGA